MATFAPLSMAPPVFIAPKLFILPFCCSWRAASLTVSDSAWVVVENVYVSALKGADITLGDAHSYVRETHTSDGRVLLAIRSVRGSDAGRDRHMMNDTHATFSPACSSLVVLWATCRPPLFAVYDVAVMLRPYCTTCVN